MVQLWKRLGKKGIIKTPLRGGVSFLHCISIFIGDEGIRTPDPLNAIQVLSQLSYIPVCPIDKLPENAGPVKRKI